MAAAGAFLFLQICSGFGTSRSGVEPFHPEQADGDLKAAGTRRHKKSGSSIFLTASRSMSALQFSKGKRQMVSLGEGIL